LNITLLNVSILTQPTKTGGSYQVADVAYKNNTFQGKVEGKKVMSFGTTAEAFKVLALAQPGETYEVDVVKNNAGYNDWTKMTKAGAVEQAKETTYKAPPGATASPRSTYETPEERAKKQVYIVRQSSVSSAIAMHSVGAKTLDVKKVLETAKEIEAHVMGTGPSGFDDFPDVPDEFLRDAPDIK
jgi:hypothetical protein